MCSFIPLVITSIEEESNLRGIGNIPIDKEIYFLDEKSLKIKVMGSISALCTMKSFSWFYVFSVWMERNCTTLMYEMA